MHVKQLAMVSVPEATTRVAMLERGEADIIYNVPGELIDRVKSKTVLTYDSRRMQYKDRLRGQSPRSNGGKVGARTSIGAPIGSAERAHSGRWRGRRG